jgi:hypothetical protein
MSAWRNKTHTPKRVNSDWVGERWFDSTVKQGQTFVQSEILCRAHQFPYLNRTPTPAVGSLRRLDGIPGWLSFGGGAYDTRKDASPVNFTLRGPASLINAGACAVETRRGATNFNA